MKKSLIILPLMIILTGCTGTGTTMVLNAPTERHIAKTYNLVEGKSTVGCDAEVKKKFEQEVRNGFAQAQMAQGSDIVIEYRFIQFDEGSQFVRYMAGGLGNAGEGAMTLEVVFKDKNNKELSKIHVGGRITAGVFGGSFDHAVEKAANQVVKYAVTNFKA